MPGIGGLFHNNRYAIRVLSAYLISLSASLLEYMVSFKLKIHIHFDAVFGLNSSYFNKKVIIFVAFKNILAIELRSKFVIIDQEIFNLF